MPELDTMSRGQKATIAVTFLIFVLTVVVNILVREWYSPDLRYSIGENYYLDDRVAFSLVINNRGHATAKNVRIDAVTESAPIIGYQPTGNISPKIIGGGIGEKRLDLEVDRLVAGSSFTIFYSLKQAQSSPVIQRIESDEGLAKTGEPRLWAFTITFPLLVFFLLLQVWLGKKTRANTIVVTSDEMKKALISRAP